MNIRDNFCTQIGVILLIATAYMHTICLTYKVIPTTPHPHIYRKAVLGELYFTRIDWYCHTPHIFFLKSRNLSTRAVSQKGHFHPAKTFMCWDTQMPPSLLFLYLYLSPIPLYVDQKPVWIFVRITKPLNSHRQCPKSWTTSNHNYLISLQKGQMEDVFLITRCFLWPQLRGSLHCPSSPSIRAASQASQTNRSWSFLIWLVTPISQSFLILVTSQLSRLASCPYKSYM